MLATLYLVAHLDRSNIGNAKIEGLTEDLNMNGLQWNLALSIFFIPYVLFGECPFRVPTDDPNRGQRCLAILFSKSSRGLRYIWVS